MEIKRIITEEMDQNCYLLKKGECGILIDPGMDTFKILRETENINIEYILLTHCHYDHIFSVKELNKKTVSSENCSENMQNPAMVLDKNACTNRSCDIIMEDGEERVFCGIKVKCIHTPGHTNGGVCYLVENSLFSGDTLFYKSIGRCDLPTGSINQLENSIKNKLYNLPDDTVVYPGHGMKTSIGFEKKNNLYVRE